MQFWYKQRKDIVAHIVGWQVSNNLSSAISPYSFQPTGTTIVSLITFKLYMLTSRISLT